MRAGDLCPHDGISAFIKEAQERSLTPSTRRRHSRFLPDAQSGQNHDFGLPASSTMRKSISVVYKPLSLWDFLNSHRTVEDRDRKEDPLGLDFKKKQSSCEKVNRKVRNVLFKNSYFFLPLTTSSFSS